MLWAASSPNFFSFCRAGELTERSYDPSSYEDISVDNSDNPSMIAIFLKKSKTDPFRKGVSWPDNGRQLPRGGTAGEMGE